MKDYFDCETPIERAYESLRELGVSSAHQTGELLAKELREIRQEMQYNHQTDPSPARDPLRIQTIAAVNGLLQAIEAEVPVLA